MNTFRQTFRWQYLAVLLAMSLLIPDAFSESERKQRRGDKQQGSAQRSQQRTEKTAQSSSRQERATRSQSRSSTPAPSAQNRSRPTSQPARRQTTAPERTAQPAPTPQSTRSAPSTRRAPSTRSSAPQRQTTTPSVKSTRRSYTPTRRVNRTVEVAGRTQQSNTTKSNTRTSTPVVTRRSAPATKTDITSTSTRISAVIMPSTTKASPEPAKTQTPTETKSSPRSVTNKVTSSRSQSRSDKVQRGARTVQPAVKASVTKTTQKVAATPTLSVDRVQRATETSKPSITGKVERAPTRSTQRKSSVSFDVVGSASHKRTNSRTSSAVQKESKEPIAVISNKSSGISVKTDTRSERKTKVRPQRVTVNDIKTEPKRVTPSRSEPQLSQQDVKRKRSVRIHSDADRNRRPGRTSVSKSADISIQTQTIQKSTNQRDFRSHDRSRRSEPSSRIVINNDNRVIVQGSPTRHHPRPHFPRRLVHDVHYIRSDPHWLRYGSGFYFSWASSSCGVVVSLPYYHSRIHYGTPYYGFSYYYPRYHRKYVFVSIGGYWPYSYRYRRYYWYGCHPYYWYGANVIYEPSRNVTYNTYNYYTTNSTNDSAGYGFSSSATPYYTLGQPKDEVIDEPEFQTAADLCFDNAIALFEAGKYEQAADQFREAVTLSPDDIILPFTYSQALFAEGDYAHAATVLRAAMANIPDEELTIYYPRGLYKSDDVLTAQIEALKLAAGNEPFASDYQLLLGYQYLGLGELDKALVPLAKAATDPANEVAAGKLIDLAAQLQAEAEAKESNI